MTGNSMSLYLRSLSILVLSFGLNACGPQAGKTTTIKPTNFAGNVGQTEKPKEEINTVTVKEPVKEEKEDSNLDELAALDAKREKLKLMQERLSVRESSKNSLDSNIVAIETELAKVVVPARNSTGAGIAYYYGDYATAIALQQQQRSAYEAAEAKKANLTALAEQKKAELVTVTADLEALRAEVDALSKEIEVETEKVYSAKP